MNVSWCAETPADEPFVRRLILEDAADTLAAEWPAEKRDVMLEALYRTRRQNLRTHFADVDSRILLFSGEPAGWLVLSESSAASYVIEMIILPQYRGMGLGTAVLGDVLKQADQASRPVRLSIRTNNPAIRLCERLGFRHVGSSGLLQFMER